MVAIDQERIFAARADEAMVFSSIIFLYVFLPLLFIGYGITKGTGKNLILLVFSLFFYAWGEPKYILLMISSIVINYLLGMAIFGNKGHAKKVILALGVIINIFMLAVFKYLDFIIGIIDLVPGMNLNEAGITLPIGISFYTFQALSYLIDVYRGDEEVEKNLVNFATYISFFPQLIAGPIVQYRHVRTRLNEKTNPSLNEINEGVMRFCIGLGKKTLIANALGQMVDSLTVLRGDELSCLSSWVAVIGFSLQLYFDFSGYSDMAIGLGKMFGFSFPENFDHPYESKSVTEFWRRWHISLGSWFRDYVYIPLGGSKKGFKRQVLSILVVWAVTGLWHGASFNFVVWGLYYAAFLLMEKIFLLRLTARFPSFLKHLYTVVVVVIGWSIFMKPDLTAGYGFYKKMAGMGDLTDRGIFFVIREYAVILVLGIIGSTGIPKRLSGRIVEGNDGLKYILSCVFISFIMVLSTAAIISDTYNPFLYFRF